MIKALKRQLVLYLMFFSARIRPLFVFWLIKIIPKMRFKDILIVLFDPNNIRKKINYNFKQKLIDVSYYGSKFRIDINDHIGYRFYMSGNFDDTVSKFAKHMKLGADDTVLDIGANIGTVTVPVAIQTGCEVIAVEASKSNAALLLHNAFIYSIKLTAFIYCLVDEDIHTSKRWLEFSIKNGNAGSNSIFDSWNSSVTENSVELTKTAVLDTLLDDVEWGKIKLAKIDVEGAEAIVLRGARKLLKLGVPILFEYRIDAMKSYLNDDGKSLIDLFGGEFKLFGVTNTDNFIKLIPFDPKQSFANAVAIPITRVNDFLEIN